MTRKTLTVLMTGMIVWTMFSGLSPSNTNPMKKIKAIHNPNYTQIGGLVTWEVIPGPRLGMQDLDPFLFLNDHGPQVYPAGNDGLPFGPHPHRGFETITFILDGALEHRDNTGIQSVIGAGGIQWMTAGKGIIHAEVSPPEFLEKGGNVHLLQLWVNLPSRLKMSEPKYIGLHAKDIPVLPFDEGKARLHLISGAVRDSSGPVSAMTGLWMSRLELDKEGEFEISISLDREVFFYNISGNIEVNGERVPSRCLVQFEAQGESIRIKALNDTQILLGHGARIGEPVVARGPFVMTSEDEINQAWSDYRKGKFGKALPE